MKRVVHVIPYDGVGGVEQAAASVEGLVRDGLRFERLFVFEDVRDRSQRRATFDPRAFWTAARRLVACQPDLVILSLWRSVLVVFLAKMVGCRAPTVLFLHNAEDAHRLDRWSTRLGARFATAVWADSTATLEARLRLPPGTETHVISFLVDRRSPVRGPDPDPGPHLVYWGRLAAQKDPLRALAVLAHVQRVRPDAQLTLIGPDGGLRDRVLEEVERLKLAGSVTLAGVLDRAGIEAVAQEASFYLQTSRYEGMALSVMEAMQYGLVPVVTPVGEIAHYTSDGETAVWIGAGDVDEEAAAARIVALIDSPELWRAMRTRCLTVWRDYPLYADDVVAASHAALATASGRRSGT